ncbi:acyl-CoA thioesterase [Robiginitalea sp. IMCC44478]|uniref:acyl-CoA thioesterase n=1 Tax=Robiginitalea sp. IMCC44478 TaxID=3459122 RepID=UPI00404280BA
MHFHQISFRVRYGETDQMGVVYHGNYPQYLEMGRVEWLRSLGISYKSMEEKGCFLPVVSLQINYKKSARYDELLTVTTRLRKLPGARITFDYEIHSEEGSILAVASTDLVFMDREKNRPIRCPDYVMDRIQNS